jgi:hypothetical protein
MSDIGSTLLNLGTAVITGIITAGVSVRFALRRFRAEQTWERKVAAYTEIFDALYNISRYAKMRLEEIEEGATFVKEYEEEANRLSSEGYDRIRRAAIKGTFVVGPEAAVRLEQIVKVFDDPHYGDDVHDEISADLEAATKGLAELRKIAHVDVYQSEAFDRPRIRMPSLRRRALPNTR